MLQREHQPTHPMPPMANHLQVYVIHEFNAMIPAVTDALI